MIDSVATVKTFNQNYKPAHFYSFKQIKTIPINHDFH